MDAIDAFSKNALNPNHPCQRGSAQNPDIFFQAREACNPYYDALPAIVQEYMDKVNAEDRNRLQAVQLLWCCRMQSMSSSLWVPYDDTIEETIDYL